VAAIRAQLTLPPRAVMATDNGNDTEYASLRTLLDGFAAEGASAWRVNAEQQDVR
jgi:hypothetical protein